MSSIRRGVTSRAITILPVARDEHIEDDRGGIKEGDPVLLIIEDAPHYARILLGLARDKGFKAIVAKSRMLVGETLATEAEVNMLVLRNGKVVDPSFLFPDGPVC